MEIVDFVQLSPNPYTNPLELKHDSNGSLAKTAPHSLWTQNAAAASQLWPIEFVATKTRINVIDTSRRGPGDCLYTLDLIETPETITENNPWWQHSPRGVTYLHVAEFLGREVLLALTDEGNLYMWRTLALYKHNKEPWFHYTLEDSAWGVDVHPIMPLIAVSDNSQKITVIELEGFQTLGVATVRQTEPLGGNIPCVCYLPTGHIAYTMLTLDLMGGAFGILDYRLKPLYTTKMQQCGWNIRALSGFLKVTNSHDLCGSATMPSEFELSECHDSCHSSYVLDLENVDHFGLRERWVEPQTWVKDQQRELKDWIRHGRRKSVVKSHTELKGSFLFITTSTHAFLVAADTGVCLASGQRAFMPPGLMPSEEFKVLALSIVEIIEPLNVAIVVSRAAVVVIVRFTQCQGVHSFRQEKVLCDFNDFVVGLTVRPARAHDFIYDLERVSVSEEDMTQDVPDKSLGDIGTYLVRLHGNGGRTEAFLLTE